MVLPDKIRDAVGTGDTATVRDWFLTRDPDEKDTDGMRSLYNAACQGRCEVMRVLLARGASPNVKTDGNWGALHGAAGHGHLDVALLLLKHGAHIEGGSLSPGPFTPLIKAAMSGNRDMIRLFLSRGANLDARADSKNAETWARDKNKTEAAALLAEIRVAGGWLSFTRFPRKRLLALRVLCARGRAIPPDSARLSFEDLRGTQLRILGASNLAEAQKYALALAPVSPGLMERLFPWRPPLHHDDAATDERATLRARTVRVTPLPKEVFSLILEFWRCDRDSFY